MLRAALNHLQFRWQLNSSAFATPPPRAHSPATAAPSAPNTAVTGDLMCIEMDTSLPASRRSSPPRHHDLTLLVDGPSYSYSISTRGRLVRDGVGRGAAAPSVSLSDESAP